MWALHDLNLRPLSCRADGRRLPWRRDLGLRYGQTAQPEFVSHPCHTMRMRMNGNHAAERDQHTRADLFQMLPTATPVGHSMRSDSPHVQKSLDTTTHRCLIEV